MARRMATITHAYQGNEHGKIFNVFVVGPAKSGKTTLIDACNKHIEPWAGYPSEYDRYEHQLAVPTSYGEISLKIIDFNGKIIHDELVNAHAVILVMDITNSDVSALKSLHKEVRKSTGSPVILAATKSDLYGDEKFKLSQIQQMGMEFGGAGCIVSGREKQNIDYLLFMVADMLANPGQKYMNVECKQSQGAKKACKGQ